MLQIYLADYLPQNRKELFRWTIGESEFDWTHVLKMIATVEGTGWLQLKEMEQHTRSKVWFHFILIKLRNLCDLAFVNFLMGLKFRKIRLHLQVRSIFHCNCHNNPAIAAPNCLQKNFDVSCWKFPQLWSKKPKPAHQRIWSTEGHAAVTDGSEQKCFGWLSWQNGRISGWSLRISLWEFGRS